MKDKPLFVVVPDRISAIQQKGEYTDRYYNPGNLFNEVHILLTNDDNPDPVLLQKTVGDARLYIHNLPYRLKDMILSFGFRPFLLQRWARPAVELARQYRPALIRCHGNQLNAFLAYVVKREMGIPYVISMHTDYGKESRRQAISLKSRLFNLVIQTVIKRAMLHADLLLPVYEPIVPYLREIGVQRIEIAYNVINPTHLRPKVNYRLHAPIRLISVGRHYDWKNPENIIRAVGKLPSVQLTLVGDGTYQENLENLVRESHLEERVIFRRSIPNDELCQQLGEHDIFVVHTEHLEISKAVLEALLTGMPVVINRRKGDQVPELQGDFLLMVENTVEGYYDALKQLIEQDDLRERLGRKAFAHARERWSPEKTEARYMEIYQRVISGVASTE